MPWYFGILIIPALYFLKRLIEEGENEGSGESNPPHSDHGNSRRGPDTSTPSTSQSSTPNKSSVDPSGGVSECSNPSKPSPLSVNQKNPVDSTVNEKSTITAEQETIKSTPAKGNEGSRTGNKVAPTSSASFSQHSSKASLSSNKPPEEHPSTSQSSIPNKSSVDSGISFGGVSECLNPSKPSSLSANQKNPVDSTVNEKSTITAEQKTIKSTPTKGNEGSRTGNNVAPTSSASFSQHSSKKSLSSNKPPVICSSGPLQSASNFTKKKKKKKSASKPLLSSSGPLSSASKATAAPLKASPSSQGPHLSASEATLSQPPLPPNSLPPATDSPKSTPKLPSASKGTPSPTPCPLDKTNPAKVVGVQKGTTPISSTNKVIENLITSPPLYSDSESESDSPPFSKGTSPFSSMPMPDPFGPPDPPNRNTYFLHEGATPIYEIPEDIKNLIKRDIVPAVLKEPLSPWTYKDYFATLLYAEEFYLEKWTNFCLENVTLELEEASIYNQSNKCKSWNDTDEYEEKLFVVFEINLIPERRPFLQSRDFVFLWPAGKKVDPFEGILHRVVKRNRDVGEFDDYHVVKRDIVLAEFGDDFHLQHSPDFKYDVSFSFNRVCLKRSHQAIAAATNLLFQNFLFPDQVSRTSIFSPPFIPSNQDLDRDHISAVEQILMFRGSPPYLIDGPLWRTELVIQEAVLQIYKSSPGCRILVSAPTNRTCDDLAESLHDEIPEMDMFRANAAFREIYVVPDDILPLCQYEGECFTCPPLERLKNIKVIFSTFMSSFRLHNEGLPAGHFSHIFLVDASSAMEPEALVVLTNLVDENTNVVVTGTSGNSPKWVRSDIARRNGLKKSYFQRLLESEPYCNEDSVFVTNLWAPRSGWESYCNEDPIVGTDDHWAQSGWDSYCNEDPIVADVHWEQSGWDDSYCNKDWALSGWAPSGWD